MFKKSFLLFVLLCIVCAERSHTVLYERSGAPGISKWALMQPAHHDVEVTFTLALKQYNLDVLERLFWDNADPNSPNYAHHLSREQVRRIVEPPQWVHDAVNDWLFDTAREHKLEAGLRRIWNGGDYLTVTTTVALAEKLFQTKLWTFVNTNNGALIIKHLGTFSIPTDLTDHIEMVTGLTEFPPTSLPFLGVERKVRQDYDNECNVPYNIKKLYGIPLDLNVTNPHANQSIYAEASYDQPEGFGVGSLSYWEQANDLPSNPINCILGNGASDFYVNDTDAEAQLDTQMMSGFAPGAKTCFYIMELGNAWMYEFSLTIFNTSNAPLVVSMSYGWWEAEQCINETDGTDFLSNCTALHIPNSQTYVKRTNTEFMKLGLVGHTLLAASGDDGTSGTHGTMDNCATMNPIFPAASPYVLTVGATSIEPSDSGSEDVGGSGSEPPICRNMDVYECECSTSTNEQACLANNTGGFDTGGGFSVFSAMPSYQTTAVNAYIKSGITLPSTQYWNPHNRGFPDVAAVGENICVLDPGSECELLGGTSASTPMWGAIITLLNQDRLNAGKTPLGFINPLIYQMYGISQTKFFNNNMKIGNNGGDCGTEQGFNAAPGWDPLTGCGSPKFAAIRKYVASLN